MAYTGGSSSGKSNSSVAFFGRREFHWLRHFANQPAKIETSEFRFLLSTAYANRLRDAGFQTHRRATCWIRVEPPCSSSGSETSPISRRNDFRIGYDVGQPVIEVMRDAGCKNTEALQLLVREHPLLLLFQSSVMSTSVPM